MVRRSLGVALWVVAGLLACFLGALAALVGTGAGRRMLGRVTEGVVTRAVAGTIEIGDVSGALLTGLTVTDLRLFDPDSTLVAWFPRAELSYNPLDFAAGRIVLLELDLTRPFFNVEERADGVLNVEALLRLGGPDTLPPDGPAPLILLRDVRIDDGTLVLRLRRRGAPAPPDSLGDVAAPDADGRLRIRRFQRLAARFRSVRLSAPRERGVRIDVDRLAFEASDPAVSVTDAHGRVTVVGDGLALGLDRLGLADSELRVNGWLRWPRDTVLYELDVIAERAALADFRWLDPRFPGGVLRGRVALRSSSGRRLEVRLDPLRLAHGGGTVTGRLTAESDAVDGLVAVRGAELEARDFDLEFVRPFLDTLPFAGRLSGRTVADGPLGALALEADWEFRDSLVPGWPTSRVRGRGRVEVSGPAGLAFGPFAVEAAEVDLRTVRRLVPGLALQGVVDAAGTLSGPYANAQFSGTLRHRHGDLPPSVARGVVRLDGRGDTLGVSADVLVDPLSFDALRASYPRLPLRGRAAGGVRLEGDVGALDTRLDLAEPGAGGRIRFQGELELLGGRAAARGFSLTATDVDLASWVTGGPPSRLSAHVAGDVTADRGTAPAGRLAVALAPSLFAGTVLDTGAARVRFADRLLRVDSLWVRQPGLRTTAGGAIGWDRSTEGVLWLELDADSLRSLDSLVAWAAGIRLDPDRPATGLAGAARVRVRLRGSLDSADAEAEAQLVGVRWRGWTVPSGEVRVALAPGSAPRVSAEARVDSIGSERYGFGGVVARAEGTPDSLTWFARARVGELGAFLAGGRLARGGPAALGSGPAADPRSAPDSTATALAVDSLAVLMAGGVWLLERPVELEASASALRIGEVVLAAVRGPGRVVVRGTLPAHGRVDASVHLESVPLAGLYSLLQRDTLGVGGVVTASVGLTGTRAAPEYRGSFALSEASFGQFRAPYLDGTLEYRDGRLGGAAHLWRAGQQILSLRAHLPLDLALETVPRRRLPDTLWVSASADSVDLSVLEALTPLVREVRGGVSADVGIRGTWDAPSLRGTLRVADAGAFIPALNVRYGGVAAHLSLSGDTIRVDSLVARSEEGRARVTGFVRLAGLAQPVLGLDLTGDRFTALDLRNTVTVTASGKLAFTGPVIGATLAGQGTVTSGVLHFADLVQKRVINLDEPWVATLIDTSLAATIRRERLAPEFQSVFLDSLRIRGLRLTMGSDVWLRSTEANIQLTGAVEVSKTGNDYLLTGTLEAPRGTYRLELGQVVSREFVVTEGTVRYFGTPDLDAALDITARHVVHPLPTPAGTTTDDIAVIARIRGTLLAPELTLEAEGRELSQTDIISYLMFGRPVGGVGGVGQIGSQAALVRTAVGRILGELERTIVSDLGVPLDYLEIRPGDPDDRFAGTRLAAGWQIGRKTFLVLNAGYCPRDDQAVANAIGASLQFRISPEWRTEASFAPVLTCGVPGSPSLTQSRQMGLDVFWERRY